MKTYKKSIASFLTVATIFAGIGAAAPQVQACSCVAGVSQEASFADAAAVFSGEVTEISTGTDQLLGSETAENRQVSFQIADSWKGAVGESVTVTTGTSSANCGFDFTENEAYLVYAQAGSNDQLSVSLCSRTAELESQQAQEDIANFADLAVDSQSTDSDPATESGQEPISSLLGRLAQVVADIFSRIAQLLRNFS